METREQQLLQKTAEPLHTLKTLHEFMVSRVTAEATYPEFYAHDMVTVHQDLVRDLQQGLRQLTELEYIVSIDKFITDVSHSAMDPEREAIRRTMCALFAVTATAMAWPMHPPLVITAVAMNAGMPSLSCCNVLLLDHPTRSPE